MVQRELSADRVKQQAHQATRVASPWIERFGRGGYVAYGVVYVLVGGLAAQAALGSGGATTDAQGVLERTLTAPFGQFLLAAIALGLAGYATWRFVQAGLDVDNKGTEPQGLLARGGSAVAGVIHVGLALAAVRLLLGADSAGSSGDQAAQDWTAQVLSQPLGQWIMGSVGVLVIGMGLYQLYKAYTADFGEQLKQPEMTSAQQRWTRRAGRLGFAARGIVFAVVGGFLIVAAMQSDPGQARGLGGALATLAASPYGPWLLGVVAVGLIAYGLFMLIVARFLRMVLR